MLPNSLNSCTLCTMKIVVSMCQQVITINTLRTRHDIFFRNCSNVYNSVSLSRVSRLISLQTITKSASDFPARQDGICFSSLLLQVLLITTNILYLFQNRVRRKSSYIYLLIFKATKRDSGKPELRTRPYAR